MELKVIDVQGAEVSSLPVSDLLFGRVYNESLVHQLVTAFLANARGGNRAQLTRAEVHHSTKKPWRQKGPGRARSGMTSSPIWRGGGRAFPSSAHENFSQKINRKMYRLGMATILSQLVRDNRLVVVDEFKIESPKTKDFIAKFKSIGLENTLFVTRNHDENICLSSRNLCSMLVLEAQQVDPYSLLRFHKVVVTREAIDKFEEQWL